jgi:hypothetical protein
VWISQTRAPIRAAASICGQFGVDEDAGNDAGVGQAG